MTTLPATPATPLAAAAPRPAAGAPPAPTATIDPLKLLNRHKWRLVIAAVVGAILGTAAHFACLYLYPIWRPIAIFNCLPPTITLVNNTTGVNLNVEEMKSFMSTQARLMTQDAILRRLSDNPELQEKAPNWAKQYMVKDADGVDRFASIEALKDLRDDVRARVVPQTTFIELSFGWHKKEDATAILQLITETYLLHITETSRQMSTERERALREALGRSEKEIGILQRQRLNTIDEGKVGGTLQDKTATTSTELNSVNQEQIEKTQKLRAVEQQIRSLEVRAEQAGDKYTDEMRQEAERDMAVVEARRVLHNLELQRQSLTLRGLPPEHRELRVVASQIDAGQQTLDAAIQRTLDKIFNAERDRLYLTERELKAQINELAEKRNALQARLTELTRLQSQIADLDRQIDNLQATKTAQNQALQETISLAGMETVRRVVLEQRPQIPTELAFPQLKLMIPAGVLIITLLTGTILLVRELVDQRIKSPSDISIIPRTRLLGWVPDAAEDPEGQGATETAFRDRSRGVVAESYRQLRSVIGKRASVAGHRAVVVLAALPGSGATTTICNLALAFAAADRRVLVIDANFRRPGVNRVFGLPEAPGLADVLSRQSTLDQAVQATGVENLSILSAGARDQRVLERVATDVMGEVLAAAKARYDLVLIDTAPAVVAGDGVSLANRCDASILVVRAMNEKRGLIARIKNELLESRGEFLGVVVNAVQSAAGGYLRGNIKTAVEYERSLADA